MREDKFPKRVNVSGNPGGASTTGVLATDEFDLGIKLTRFNDTIQNTAHVINFESEKIEIKHPNGLETSRTASRSPVSAPSGKCLRQQNGMISYEGRAFSNQSSHDLLANQPEHGANRAQDHDASKQFMVVWRSLSFDVRTSNYERLMNGARRAFTSILKHSLLSFGGDATHKLGSLEPVNKIPGDMTPNCRLSASQRISPDGVEPHVIATYDQRNIFKNLNGYVRSNEISAILGPSGTGKTSLLNALCGCKLNNYRGLIELVRGDSSNERMQLSIIPQKDYLIENLTVRENLLYSSQLFNADENFDHEANITRVVRTLNLSHCFHSTTGKISGGEHKRVSIAQELLRQPDILILDEPTSGLDSLNCKKLIKTLKALIEASRTGAMKPLAVVMTIHQPDIDIFNMFDHVYCMARGGRVVFDGHPSAALSTIKQFAGFELGAPDMPPEIFSDKQVNPANLLIEIASEDIYGQEPINRLARFQHTQFDQMQAVEATRSCHCAREERMVTHQLQSNVRPYAKQEERRKKTPKRAIKCLFSRAIEDKLRVEIPSKATPTSSSSPCKLSNATGWSSDDHKIRGKSLQRDKRLSMKHNHEGKFWYHTCLLARRALISTLCDPLMTVISLMFHLSVPFVMWSVYPRRVGRVHACPVIARELDIISMASDKTLDRMSSMQDELMATVECSTMLFITAYALSMCSMTIAALVFPLNMHILLKEVRNDWYDLKAFVLAKQLANFPFEVLFPSATMVMIYVMLDMPSSDYEWRLCLIATVTALLAMISTTHGLIIGTLCMDSVQTAVFLSIASTLPQIMLSGFTARLRFLPALYRHLSWISVYRYASQLLNTIRFGFGICPCDEQTDQYLRSKKPTFTDIPSSLKPVFLYYLSTRGENTEAVGTQEPADENATAPVGSNRSLQDAKGGMRGGLIVGVNQDLTLSLDEKNALLTRMESGEVDVFSQMAESMTRSLSYGRPIASCKDVKSQLLSVTETQDEDMFLYMIFCVVVLVLFFKILLFIVVKYKVRSRT